MGIDPGWGVSSFGIVVTHFVDGLIRVAYADEHSRSNHSEMVSVVGIQSSDIMLQKS